MHPSRNGHLRRPLCARNASAGSDLTASHPAMPQGAQHTMATFLQELRIQRLDDHRFYHHSRINQSLHLVSALSFVAAYGLLFVHPPLAAVLAWCVSMVTRQAGHFFFEPRGYDEVNQVSDEYKEEIKVGYNIFRKVLLMSAWAAIPVLLFLQPDVFGFVEPAQGVMAWVEQVGWAWLFLGAGAVLLRVLQLALTRDPRTGIVWASKIFTDPFHDILMYYRAPLALLRGELIDPMHHLRH